MHKILAPLFGLFALLTVQISSATILSYTSTLSGLNEAPSNLSPGIGTSTLSWDTILQTLTVDITFSGLSANVTVAHIHCCAAAGDNAAIAVGLLGFPTGVTGGVYNHVFALTDFSIFRAAFLTQSGGTAAGAEAALFNAFSTQLAYINIHTTALPGGEIRGQVQASRVPEPASLFLIGTGLLGLTWMRARKRSHAAFGRA